MSTPTGQTNNGGSVAKQRKRRGTGSPARVSALILARNFFSSSGPMSSAREGLYVVSFLASTHALSFLPNGRFFLPLFFLPPRPPSAQQHLLYHRHQQQPPPFHRALLSISTKLLMRMRPARFKNALTPTSSTLCLASTDSVSPPNHDALLL